MGATGKLGVGVASATIPGLFSLLLYQLDGDTGRAGGCMESTHVVSVMGPRATMADVAITGVAGSLGCLLWGDLFVAWDVGSAVVSGYVPRAAVIYTAPSSLALLWGSSLGWLLSPIGDTDVITTSLSRGPLGASTFVGLLGGSVLLGAGSLSFSVHASLGSIRPWAPRRW